MGVGGCTVKYYFLTKRVLGSMLIIFLSFSAFFEVFFYSIISVGLIYSQRERTSSTHYIYCSYQEITKLRIKKHCSESYVHITQRYRNKCLVIKGNFIKLLNKKFIENTNTTKNNQMINILITGSHHTCTNRA